MASSIQKQLWASSGFQSRTAADRKAYRAKLKAEREAFYAQPEQREAQAKINTAHAAWVAAGMPENQ
jgi:hypothetical protein